MNFRFSLSLSVCPCHIIFCMCACVYVIIFEKSCYIYICYCLYLYVVIYIHTYTLPHVGWDLRIFRWNQKPKQKQNKTHNILQEMCVSVVWLDVPLLSRSAVPPFFLFLFLLMFLSLFLCLSLWLCLCLCLLLFLFSRDRWYPSLWCIIIWRFIISLSCGIHSNSILYCCDSRW